MVSNLLCSFMNKTLLFKYNMYGQGAKTAFKNKVVYSHSRQYASDYSDSSAAEVTHNCNKIATPLK